MQAAAAHPADLPGSAVGEGARRSLERLGVEVLLNSRVERIDDEGRHRQRPAHSGAHRAVGGRRGGLARREVAEGGRPTTPAA